MDGEVTLAKLESLHRCLRRIETRRPSSVEALLADIDAQDILSLNLERAIQLCVDLAAMSLADRDEPPPISMREAFLGMGRLGLLTPDLAARLAGAVTLRNILVHEYARVDWARVFDAVDLSLPDLEAFARVVASGFPGRSL